MNKLIKQFENIMVAVTFAEAGEYDEVSRGIDGVSREQGDFQDFKKTAAEGAGQ